MTRGVYVLVCSERTPCGATGAGILAEEWQPWVQITQRICEREVVAVLQVASEAGAEPPSQSSPVREKPELLSSAVCKM